jgi:uncharacterized protein (TIGR02284 family)
MPTGTTEEATMVPTTEKTIEELNELIHYDYDAVGAYTAAINDIKENNIRDPLIQFRGDHERHIVDLSAVVRRLGGKPAERPDIKGFVRKTMTRVAGLGGTELILKAMRSNEEVLNKAYAHHLEKFEFTADIMELLRKNYADEQRHLAWVEQAILNRLWEATSGAHP